jgi:hypothetical protein
MKTSNVQQRSDEWFQLRRGRIGGTRFGQVLSNVKNRLIYELLSERIDDLQEEEDEYDSFEMQFGRDNEDMVLQMYTDRTGIQTQKVGVIFSDFCEIHMASPDACSIDTSIIQEVKCTLKPSIQRQRYFEGIDAKLMPQVISYFALSDEVKEVHWISYCPFAKNSELIIHTVKRDTVTKDGTIQQIVEKSRVKLISIEKQLKEMEAAL